MNYLCPLPGALRKCGLARVFEAVRLFPAKLRHFLWSAKKVVKKSGTALRIWPLLGTIIVMLNTYT